MALTERELAEWLMSDRGQTYVDSMNGETLGGITLSELHMQHCFNQNRLHIFFLTILFKIFVPLKM